MLMPRLALASGLYLAAGCEVLGREPDALRQHGTRDTMVYMTLALASTPAAGFIA
jgi:hypothetical protein